LVRCGLEGRRRGFDKRIINDEDLRKERRLRRRREGGVQKKIEIKKCRTIDSSKVSEDPISKSLISSSPSSSTNKDICSFVVVRRAESVAEEGPLGCSLAEPSVEVRDSLSVSLGELVKVMPRVQTHKRCL
jgi:hypothetical protein